MPRLVRTELWSNWPGAPGAQHLDDLPRVLRPVLTSRAGAERGFTCGIPRGSRTAPIGTEARALADVYAKVQPGRVLRLILSNRLWVNVRIMTAPDLPNDGGVTAITCGGLSTSLAKTPPIQTVTNGVPSFVFDGTGLTAEDHLTKYLQPQWDAIGLTFLEVGYIHSTKRLDIPYTNDKCWSALQKIEAATECEAWLRDDYSAGTTYLDLLPRDATMRVGSGFEMDADGRATLSGGLPVPASDFGDPLAAVVGPRLHYGFNAAIGRTRSEVEQFTRMYGAGEGGVTIAEARWIVADVTGDDVELADLAGGPGPILVNDQLNGRYLEADDRLTRIAITDSAADDQTVTLTSASAFAVGDRVRICADVAGAPLLYLEDPEQVAMHGVLAGSLDRPDIPETVNLVVNADQSVWTGGPSTPADGWAAVGAATLTRTTDAAHRELGPYSCKVETTADGQGYACPLTHVLLTPGRPYVAGCLSFKIVSGTVRIELIATDGTDVELYPDGVSQVALTNDTGAGFALKGVAGIDSLRTTGANQVRMRLVQHGPTPAVFYVDAAQITESPGQLPLVIGAGPTQLYQAVNAELALTAPTRVRYEGEAIDFFRLYQIANPHLELVLGALHTVDDDELGAVDGVRLLQTDEAMDVEGQTKVTLSSLPGDMRSFRERVNRPRQRTAISGVKIVAGALSARTFSDAVTTASSTTLTSESADFTAEDVGEVLWVLGAGADGGILKTTVTSVTAENEIEMADPAVATLTNAIGIVGSAGGVLSLAAGLSPIGGGGGAVSPDLPDALFQAQLRELARRIAEIGATSGGGPGDPGPEGPPGNSYAPIIVTESASGDPGDVTAMEVDAPAIGIVLKVTAIPPSQIDILGTAAATTPELDLIEAGFTNVVPGAIVANRDGLRADKWYLNVTPTTLAWDTEGSTEIASLTGDVGVLESFVDVVPFANPGLTGIAGWYCFTPDDYFFTAFFISIFGVSSGAGGDSAYPVLVDAAIPYGATTIRLWSELYVQVGVDPHSYSLVLSANGNGHLRQIEARITQEWDGDSTTTFTLELAYTNNAGTRTVLDTDSSTSIPISGSGNFGLLLELTRNAEDEYDMTATFARQSELSYSDESALGTTAMTIGTPDLSVGVTVQAVDAADHYAAGFRMIDCEPSDTDAAPFISLQHFGLGYDTIAESGVVSVAVQVMPIFYVDPPEE